MCTSLLRHGARIRPYRARIEKVSNTAPKGQKRAFERVALTCSDLRVYGAGLGWYTAPARIGGIHVFSRGLPLTDWRTTRCVDLADSVNCPFWALFRRLDLRLGRSAQALVSAQFTARPRGVSGPNDDFGRRDIVGRAPRYRHVRTGGLRVTISSSAKWSPEGPKERLILAPLAPFAAPQRRSEGLSEDLRTPARARFG